MRYNNLHDWKGHFINDMINDLNYKSYLELGVSTSGESWKRISCPTKVGVDSDIRVSKYFDGVIHSTTDEFFKKSNIKFDIIYIDALHEKNQVYKDFKNSYNCLNENGIIVFHDINPLQIEQTSHNSSGDVFEIWIDICKNYKVITYSSCIAGRDDIDTVGILSKKENPKFINFEVNDYSFEYFTENRSEYIYSLEYTDLINKIKN